jgi:hypothetical protein
VAISGQENGWWGPVVSATCSDRIFCSKERVFTHGFKTCMPAWILVLSDVGQSIVKTVTRHRRSARWWSTTNCLNRKKQKKIDAFIKQNWSMTVSEIPAPNRIWNNAVQETVGSLGYWKDCAGWVSNFPTEQKTSAKKKKFPSQSLLRRQSRATIFFTASWRVTKDGFVTYLRLKFV